MFSKDGIVRPAPLPIFGAAKFVFIMANYFEVVDSNSIAYHGHIDIYKPATTSPLSNTKFCSLGRAHYPMQQRYVI